MNKPYCLILLNKAQQIIRIIEDSEVLIEKSFSWTTAAALTGHIKNAIQKQSGVKEAYCIIDDEACYYRLVDGEKTKEELRSAWNIPEDQLFCYFESKSPEWKNIYYGLSYPQELILGYAAAVKKSGLICAGIIPADFIFHFSAVPGIYQEQLPDKQRIKIFDQAGGYYSTTLYGSLEDQRLENLLAYVEREKLAVTEGLSLKPNFTDLDQLVRLRTFLQPCMIVFAQNLQNFPVKKKVKMTLKQKTAWTFLFALLVLMVALFLRQAYFGYSIQKDIDEYNKQYAQIALQYKQLQEIEQKTKYLKTKIIRSNLQLNKILDIIFKHKLTLKEIGFDQRRKQISIIAFDPEDYRNALIKELQANNLFASVTLIYVIPNGNRTEFKIVVLAR